MFRCFDQNEGNEISEIMHQQFTDMLVVNPYNYSFTMQEHLILLLMLIQCSWPLNHNANLY